MSFGGKQPGAGRPRKKEADKCKTVRASLTPTLRQYALALGYGNECDGVRAALVIAAMATGLAAFVQDSVQDSGPWPQNHEFYAAKNFLELRFAKPV